MISDFLVAHPTSPFLFLSEEQWNRATKKYPSLLETDGIHYDKNTCTGSIIPGQDSYFDSDTILSQFERLFQMLEFKTEYQNPVRSNIEILVDNARTHTALSVNIGYLRFILLF